MNSFFKNTKKQSLRHRRNALWLAFGGVFLTSTAHAQTGIWQGLVTPQKQAVLHFERSGLKNVQGTIKIGERRIEHDLSGMLSGDSLFLTQSKQAQQISHWSVALNERGGSIKGTWESVNGTTSGTVDLKRVAFIRTLQSSLANVSVDYPEITILPEAMRAEMNKRILAKAREILTTNEQEISETLSLKGAYLRDSYSTVVHTRIFLVSQTLVSVIFDVYSRRGVPDQILQAIPLAIAVEPPKKANTQPATKLTPKASKSAQSKKQSSTVANTSTKPAEIAAEPEKPFDPYRVLQNEDVLNKRVQFADKIAEIIHQTLKAQNREASVRWSIDKLKLMISELRTPLGLDREGMTFSIIDRIEGGPLERNDVFVPYRDVLSSLNFSGVMTRLLSEK